MPIIARASAQSGEDFAPAPAGMHRAICCDVVDLGKVDTTWGPKHKVLVAWQTEALIPESGKPYYVAQRYTLSLDERSNLRRDLETWRTKPFTLTEAAGFDLETLIGHECGLVIVHKEGSEQGRIFANVQAVLPKLPGAKLAVRDYVRRIHRNGDAKDAAPTPIGPSFAPPPSQDQPPVAITADDIPF